MRTGARNKLVLIQRPGGSKNALGERITTWTTVGTAWAGIRALSGREAAISAQREAESQQVVEIDFARAWAGIASGWRVLEGQRFVASAAANSLTVAGPRAWAANDPVWFASSGTLPAPLAAGTRYYVKTAAAGVYTLAATAGGAEINLTDAGTGLHMIAPRALVLSEPPRNVDERDRTLELYCSEGLRDE